jgi:hypothetical protein
VRSQVQKRTEALRGKGAIGSAAAGQVESRGGQALQRTRSLGDDLRFVLITSGRAERSGLTAQNRKRISVHRAAHAKCSRCWHYRADIGADSRPISDLCGRCVANLYGAESRAAMPEPQRVRWWAWLAVSAGVIVTRPVDQARRAAKHRVRLARTGLRRFFDLVLVLNPGAAFSFLSTATGWQREAVHRHRGGGELF